MSSTRRPSAGTPGGAVKNPRRGGGLEEAKRQEQALKGAAVAFDLTSEVASLRKESAWTRTGRHAKTLLVQPDLRIVLTALRAGLRLQEHKAEGTLSVQVLEGFLRIHLPERVVDLPVGHVLALDRLVGHDVEAVEDSIFLVSSSWRRGQLGG